MRVGMNGVTPHIYLGENSTGKRIQCEVSKQLCEYVKHKEPNEETINKNGNTYSVLERDFVTDYNQHELSLLIASVICEKVDYTIYRSCDEDTKSKFSKFIAEKIVEWMANNFSLTGVSRHFAVRSGFIPVVKRGAIVTTLISPKIPERGVLTNCLPTKGFTFLASKPQGNFSRFVRWLFT